MIVDCHTHVFPPDFIARRQSLLSSEPAFARLYGQRSARLASGDELIRSMAQAAIDVSVVLGFAWQDADLCCRHNDYLLSLAATSGGRIVAFCSLPLAAGSAAIVAEAQRCLSAGARGFGELRPDDLGFDLCSPAGDDLGRLATELNAPLLFHASEPVGHAYPGKEGLALGPLYRFIERHQEACVIAAHWGGGLPFYALMPEVRQALRRTWFDCAATSLLYSPDIFRVVADLAGADRILFGSDYPLLSQARCRERAMQAPLSDGERALLLGENARRLLGLS